MKNLVVSLHDVSPLTQSLCDRILEELQQQGINQTSLLVIPNHHNQAPIDRNPLFRRWLTEKILIGHEPVLHGYAHLRTKTNANSGLSALITEVYTAGEGEFFDLNEKEATGRLLQGLADLSFLPRKISGFIAPAWLLSSGAELALVRLGFRYTTRLASLHVLGQRRRIPSLSLVWSTRAWWRTISSLSWNHCLPALLTTVPLLRLGIHPPDYQHPFVWRQIRRILRDLLPKRRCVSYEKFVETIEQPRIATGDHL